MGTNEEGFEWKEMRDSDIWCMEDPEQEKKCAKLEERCKEKKRSTFKQRNTENLDGPGMGEGYQQVLWIWESVGTNADGETGM